MVYSFGLCNIFYRGDACGSASPLFFPHPALAASFMLVFKPSYDERANVQELKTEKANPSASRE